VVDHAIGLLPAVMYLLYRPMSTGFFSHSDDNDDDDDILWITAVVIITNGVFHSLLGWNDQNCTWSPIHYDCH
jgi:hypothetical protein